MYIMDSGTQHGLLLSILHLVGVGTSKQLSTSIGMLTIIYSFFIIRANSEHLVH